MKYQKEIDALSNLSVKHMTLKEIRKTAPKVGKFVDKTLADLQAGKILPFEVVNVFGYQTSEFVEVVYGLDAYHYFMQK